MVESMDARGRLGWILAAGFGVALLAASVESSPQETPEPGLQTQGLPITQGYATADSNGSMIAVTGIDVTGSSLLYLVDTESRHLTVYQATGGTRSTMKLKWVGARNIDLDLQVDGWNDESEYTYKAATERVREARDAHAPRQVALYDHPPRSRSIPTWPRKSSTTSTKRSIS